METIRVARRLLPPRYGKGDFMPFNVARSDVFDHSEMVSDEELQTAAALADHGADALMFCGRPGAASLGVFVGAQGRRSVAMRYAPGS